MFKPSIAIMLIGSYSMIALADEAPVEETKPQQIQVENMDHPEANQLNEPSSSAPKTNNTQENQNAKPKSKHFHPRDGK